jgi:hypothetical protein
VFKIDLGGEPNSTARLDTIPCRPSHSCNENARTTRLESEGRRSSATKDARRSWHTQNRSAAARGNADTEVTQATAPASTSVDRRAGRTMGFLHRSAQPSADSAVPNAYSPKLIISNTNNPGKNANKVQNRRGAAAQRSVPTVARTDVSDVTGTPCPLRELEPRLPHRPL